MATVMREWQSTEPNPDEDYLKTLWEAEIKNSERAVAKSEETSRRRQANIMPLLKLNFQAGAANYVYIPYVYWYLRH